MAVSEFVCLVRGGLLGLRETWYQGVPGLTGEAALGLVLICHSALI